MTRRYVGDVSPALWIQQRVHPFAQDVGSLVPDTFESYARVLHPAWLGGTPVAWRDVARATGRVIHPEMQFGNIAGTWSGEAAHSSNWSDAPRPGTLTIELARALSRVLGAHTTSRRCWFAVWEGWGGLAVRPVPRLALPSRGYYLAEGSIDDATASVYERGSPFYSASIWWPEDHAWLVATEVDLDSTYVGASAAAVDAVLADPAIEGIRARASDGITAASDEINPAPSPPHR